MSDQKLRIQIETTATGQGVQQTAAGLDKLAGSAQKAAPAVGQLGGQTKQTAAELGRGVEVGNAASMMVQNLASSTKGGASGFLSLARGAFGAGVALKGVLASLGPVGAIAAGIGIALGLITAALRKNEEAAEAQRKKLEEVNQQKLDKAIEEQAKLGRAAGEAVAQIEAERAALERIADAELNLRKSRIDADESLSDEEKARQKLALDRRREDEKRAGALADQETKAQKLQEAASKSRKSAENVEGEYNRQKNALDELTAATKAYADAKAVVDLQSTAGTSVLPELQQAMMDALARKQRAQANAADVSPATLAAAKDAAMKAREQSNDDRDRAEAARSSSDLEYTTQQAENTRRNETRRNQDIANRPETEAEKAKREADQAKARAKAELAVDNLGLGVWQNRAAGGQVDAITLDVLRKRYPNVEFRTPAAPTAPLTPPSVGAFQPTSPALPNRNAMQLGGGALPTNTTGVYLPGQQLPAGAVDPRNQITRGSIQPGSDNKLADQTKALNQTMQKTGEQAEKKVDLQPAVEGAKKVQEGQEQLRDSLAQATDAQAAAMEQARAAQDSTVAKLGEVVSAQNSLRSDFAALAAQVRSMRVA